MAAGTPRARNALSLCIIDEPLRAAVTYGLSCLAFPLDFSLGLEGSVARWRRCLFQDGMQRAAGSPTCRAGLGLQALLGQLWGWGQGWLPNETPVPKVLGSAALPHSPRAEGSAFPKAFP